VPHRIVGDETLFDVVFIGSDVRDYRGTFNADKARNAAFNGVLRDEGIFKSAGKTYPSLALGEDELDWTRRAVGIAAAHVSGG
jgi:glutamate-1-semialdehyde 2,1-aminomutase